MRSVLLCSYLTALERLIRRGVAQVEKFYGGQLPELPTLWGFTGQQGSQVKEHLKKWSKQYGFTIGSRLASADRLILVCGCKGRRHEADSRSQGDPDKARRRTTNRAAPGEPLCPFRCAWDAAFCCCTEHRASIQQHT